MGSLTLVHTYLWHFNSGMISLYPVISCVWLVACVFKLLGKDNKVDSSAALFVCNVSEHTQHKDNKVDSSAALFVCNVSEHTQHKE